jgi:cytochrome c oxidase cbb3-type subunit III
MMRARTILTILFLSFGGYILSCQGDRRSVEQRPPFGPGAPRAQQSDLVPGLDRVRAMQQVKIDDSEEMIAEGKRLFGWYNCSGCHFNGGGGIGPALMNDEWIYGSEPHNIADTIINGRPQGMPAYGGRIPDAHIAPIVVYVRSLSGLGTAAEPTPTPLPKGRPERQKEIEQPGSKEERQVP